MIPFSRSSDKYLTVHPYSNPTFDYMPWVVSDHITQLDLANVTLRTQDREGILCPWEPHGLVWEYKTKEGDWLEDSTIKVNCN